MEGKKKEEEEHEKHIYIHIHSKLIKTQKSETKIYKHNI